MVDGLSPQENGPGSQADALPREAVEETEVLGTGSAGTAENAVHGGAGEKPGSAAEHTGAEKKSSVDSAAAGKKAGAVPEGAAPKKSAQKCGCWNWTNWNIKMKNSTLWLVVLLVVAVVGSWYMLSAVSGASGVSCPFHSLVGGAAGTTVPTGAVIGAGAAGQASGATGASGAGTGNAGQTGGSAGSGGATQPAAQDVYVKALGGANFGTYDNNQITVKKGVPVKLHFTAEPSAGCGQTLVVYGLNVRVTSRNGQEAVAEFTPKDAGTYEYSCSMHMFGPGKLTVI